MFGATSVERKDRPVFDEHNQVYAKKQGVNGTLFLNFMLAGPEARL
jgi:hypothetical protein